MTLDQDIAFWRRAADEAKNRSFFLLCVGIMIGLTMSKEHR